MLYKNILSIHILLNEMKYLEKDRDAKSHQISISESSKNCGSLAGHQG